MKLIITGTGRSGTSFVARKLYEAGFPLGEQFIPPNSRNPEGYFEDIEVVGANKQLTAGEIEALEWYDRLKDKVVAKDPHFADNVGAVEQFFPDVLWVICERNKEDTLRSMEKTMTPEKALDVYTRRVNNLKHLDAIRIKI
ncbi:MAG: hypothetical protein WD361_10545 [Gracilimonas sp.]